MRLLILAIYVSIVFPFSAQAAETEEMPEYFADHFDQLKINDNWNVIEGPWSIDAGQLTVSKGQGYKAVWSGDQELGDVTVETDLSLSDRSGDAGLLFRTVSATPGADNVQGYYAGITASGTGAVMLGRMNNSWNELKRASVTMNPNTKYHLKVHAVGSEIQVYLNDNLVLEQTDTAYARGNVGIRMYNSLPSYDNFTVKSVEGETILSDTFDQAQDQAIEHWQAVDGSWKLQAGTITVNKGDGYKIMAEDAEFGDMTLETDVKLPSDTGTGDAGMVFRTQSAAPGADNVKGYYAGLSGDGNVILGRMNNNWTPLKIVKKFDSVDPNRFYHLKVVTYGNDIKVYVNDTRTPVLEFKGESTDKYLKGGVGLRSYRAQPMFDHFIASEYVVPPQTVEAPTPNQSPLVQTPFIPLPLGSIEAKGWLLKQLELQRDGATGYAEDLYSELSTNAGWLGGNAPDSDWERPVYYLKGLVPLAYTLRDQDLIATSQKWISAILQSQHEDGSFGPSTNDDWWPRMVALYAMKDYYEATKDARVLTFMTNYFHYQASQLPTRPLRDWGKMRVGDNIDTVLWLYNRTEDSFLLNLADTLAEQGYPLTDIFTNDGFQNYGDDFQPMHAVNVNEAIKMPTVYYQRSNDAVDRDAFQAGVENLKKHEQITGMPSGTEMLAGIGSTQGVELCAITERMQSNEEAAMILGDAHIGDALEKIAFNSLPGAMDKELKNHQYYSLPNQVESNLADHGFKQEYDNGTMPSPTSGYPCCRFNLHMGWPYFVKNMWAGVPEGGLGVIAYGPSRVKTRIKQADVTIDETTNYPFEDQIGFDVTASRSVQFPLKLRIPAWADGPTVTVNGVSQQGVISGEYMTIDRTWNSGDRVVLTVPMKLKTSTWVNNSVGIERGPLVFSLQMDENWQVESSPIAAKPGFDAAALGFNQYQISAQNPWNYGLLIDREHPEATIEVVTGPMPENPFLQASSPVKLIAKAKRISAWGKAANNVEAAEPPAGPVQSDEAIENITLVPYGSENLRVTYFPQATDKAEEAVPVQYEAEQANTFHVQLNTNNSASGGKYIGGMDYEDSYVSFTNVEVPEDGAYDMDIWYANGSGFQAATGKVLVNGEEKSIKLQGTRGWGRFMAFPLSVQLHKGSNTITFMKGTGFYELDDIVVRPHQAGVTEPDSPPAAALTGPDTVTEGQPFQTLIGISGVTQNVYAQDITVTYDPSKIEYAGSEALKDTFVIVDERKSEGQIRFIMANLGLPADQMEDPLLQLNWTAAAGSADGNTSISVSKAIVADASGEEQELESASHSLSIQAAVQVDKSVLIQRLAEAQAAYDSAIEGNSPGQYPAGSKAALQSAIDRAGAVANHSSATQAEVNQAAGVLQAALQTFLSSVVHAESGDTNQDGKYSIADLAIVASAYGKSSSDAD
ncbi:family 16 glycoside hydrolase [Paenibacillus hexagrammi]|uniref:Glycoside hydrolase family 127 protein n=1 Tax=Paenibacillus hexagrammi TaxID=2908839 RepID=A0ABY3SQI1_9BACL|nr:family 16 glycoside hydrolase [Paenibacillus sp. YPD9-1]UJF35810.1 glycoside hydrolase family 127 protein [Paenibacillus sp. YPD9-1]